MPRSFQLLPLFLLACNEYNLEHQDQSLFASDVCPLEIPSVVPVDLNATCDVPIQAGTFTPVIEWNLWGYNSYGPPSVGQLDDDNHDGVIDALDSPDIVFIANDYYQGLVAVDGVTGQVKWTSEAVTDGSSGTAIGDLNGDGRPEIVAADGVNTVVAMDNRGNQLWRAQVDSGGLSYFLYPSIADMDGDGMAEVIAGRTIISSSGNIVGTGKHGVGACQNRSTPSYIEGSVSVAVDLDADGELEVVVGNAAYNRDGSTKWANGLSDGVPAVADMDLDGEPEIVVVGQNMVWTLETDGSPTGWSDSFPNTNYLGPPAIDDLDGDGDPEFVVVGSGEMRAYHWDGTILWTQQVQDWSGAAGPVLFDFEMDGYPEVVYADETTVRIFNGLDGSIKLISDEHSSPTGFETPVVADVDADGQVEIVMLHGTGSVGISVYGDANESWPAGRQVWNQHAYSITNVEPEGGIPADQIANWTRYNNFRSGDAGLPPSEWEDLEPEVVEVCTNGCPGTLAMSMRILNRGTEDVTGDFTVAVRAGQDGPVIGTTVYTGTITSGMSSEGVFIEVDLKELDGKKPVVVLDRGAGAMALLAECDIGNNWTHLGEECP